MKHIQTAFVFNEVTVRLLTDQHDTYVVAADAAHAIGYATTNGLLKHIAAMHTVLTHRHFGEIAGLTLTTRAFKVDALRKLADKSTMKHAVRFADVALGYASQITDD